MKIAILGAGFTGLAAALRLLQQGHEVTLIEKEDQVGGLACGFKKKEWNWTLEKTYHHWFTNDGAVLKLAKELNVKTIVKRPSTDLFLEGDIKPFDSVFSLLSFPYLTPLERLRTGLITFYLKYLGKAEMFEGKKALSWLRKAMGQKVSEILWEPLFIGKFGDLKENISLTWFWGRIKKRSQKLVYPAGGFQAFAENIAEKIKQLGGEIVLSCEVKQIDSSNPKTKLIFEATPQGCHREFDIVISTLPTPIFTHITPNLPQAYIKRINSVTHLSALNLILILKKPFLKKSYWLNITDKSFPFLVLAEQTNFMDPENYGNQHILYIGNYLPKNHPYLKMTAKELLKIFDPYLSKINPAYKLSIINYQLSIFHDAQPVVTPDYLKLIPEFKSPLKNIYIANMDMVYPWDRETNYAIEMGEKIADEVSKK